MDIKTLSILCADGIVREMFVDIEENMIIGTVKEKEKEMITNESGGETYEFMQGMSIGILDCSSTLVEPNNYDNLKPERVIYSERTTICIWKDGTKTVVKATEDDHMTKEHGVAMAIMRRLFSSRQEFLRVVNGGYDVIEEAKKRVREKAIRKTEIAKEQAEARERKEAKERKKLAEDMTKEK